MYMKKILLIIVILLISGFLVFYFWAQTPQFDSADYNDMDEFSHSYQPPSDSINILTYNLGYLSGMNNNLPVDLSESSVNMHLTQAKELINKHGIDVLALQEVDFNSKRSFHMNQYEELAKACFFTNGAMAVNWDKRYVPFPYWPIKYHFGSMYSGQALLTKFKMISNEAMVLPKPSSNAFYYNAFYLERLAQFVWCLNGMDSMLFINVHFEAWDRDTRELQAEIVLEKIRSFEDQYPIIILGDFNARPPFDDETGEETMRLLLEDPAISMVTSENDYQNKPSLNYTFNSDSPYEKIDYILYNNRFLYEIDSKVLHEAGEISDHLPLFARLGLTNK